MRVVLRDRLATMPGRVHWFAIALFLFGAAPCAWPQASTATVSGTVRDQSGAVIARAAVELTNTATGFVWRTTANDVGFYAFRGVIPGPYRLEVEAPGMQRYQAGLTVQVQESLVIDPVLVPGQTTTTIEVRDATPMVVVDSPTLGTVLDRQRIEQLPINGRSVVNLVVTVPGIEGYMRAYGQAMGSYEMVLDGTPIEDRHTGWYVRRLPGLDTIQEFKVESNNSSAKFTRPTTVVLSTKSGTNAFHGAAFETHRNNAIGKARQRTDYYSKPPQLIRNEFGASAGGPVYLPKLYNGRNKTFWFFGVEWLRNITSRTLGFSVPTVAMRNGDFSGAVDSQGRLYRIYNPWTTNTTTWAREPFNYGGKINVIDPKYQSPVSKYLYSVTPLPTLPDANPLIVSNWWGPVPRITRSWTASGRFDHRFSDKDQFYVRYTIGDYYWSYEYSGLPTTDGAGNATAEIEPNKSIGISWVRNISPTMFNELLISASRQNYSSGPPNKESWPEKLGTPNPFRGTNLPRFTSTGMPGGNDYRSPNNSRAPQSYFVLDNHTTKIKGKHELQFGVHYRFDHVQSHGMQEATGSIPADTAATSLYDPATSRTNPQSTPQTGFNNANLYIGALWYYFRFNRPFYYGRVKEYALYFQDNFKVTPRLTLNLGMRWEYWPAFRDKNGVMVSFDRQRKAWVVGGEMEKFYRLGATLPSIVRRIEELGGKFMTWKEAGYPEALMNSNADDFGPRLGFAYRLQDHGRPLVLRGGFRTAYFSVPTRILTSNAQFTAPFGATFQYNPDSASMSPDGIARYTMRAVPPVIAGVNSRDVIDVSRATSISRGSPVAQYPALDQPDGRTQDWNLTVEKEIMPNTVARAAYIGNHGTGLGQWYRYNDETPDYIWFVTTGLPLPTGEYASVARRPYDQQFLGSTQEYRKTGWSNTHGFQLELERRYSRGLGFQLFYVMNNALMAGEAENNWSAEIRELNQFLPGKVPVDMKERNRFLNYARSNTVPKHRLRWNWIADLPFGKGKWIGGSASGFLNKLIGGWQVAGLGTLRSNYFALPTDIYPNGNKIEVYGYKYPIQDCRGGTCYPGYLWWNGYIPAHQINSVDANGRPNGIMGVPANYKPAAEPLIPWPKEPNPRDPMYPYYGTNTVWVPLKNGTLQRTTYNDGLHPWRNQLLPSVRQWNVDASLFKAVKITEALQVRLNADFFNVFNMPGNPASVSGNGILSTRSSGQAAREMQLTLRVTW